MSTWWNGGGAAAHQTSIDEDNVEEERRLAYVGITRAQTELTFTSARSAASLASRCGRSRAASCWSCPRMTWSGKTRRR